MKTDVKKYEVISNNMKTKTLYKFLRTGLKSNSGDHTWEMDKWYHEDKVEICDKGFHASKTPLQAFSYVAGEIVAQVEVSGESEIQDDKESWSYMRIIKAYHWKRIDSIALAIYAAELVLHIFEEEYPEDDRPRKAIEAAKKVLSDDTEENRKAATSASSTAHAAAHAAYPADAHAAAYAAHVASYVAASTSTSAAFATAYAAHAFANSAAHAAHVAHIAHIASVANKKEITSKLDEWFADRIKTLKPYVASNQHKV